MSRRTAKARGSAAERELLHKLYEEGWGAVRAAGSGSIPLEVPDIITGTTGRTLAIEVKYCSKDRQYLKTQEVIDLIEFAHRFDCEAWIGVRFTRRGWFFLQAKHLKSSGKHYVVSHADALQRAQTFEQLITENPT